MVLLGITLIIIFCILSYYFIKRFIKQLLINDKTYYIEKKKRKEEKEALRQRRRDYYDFHNQRIIAEEHVAQRNFLANIQPFNLVGTNSNATRFRNHLLGR